MAQVAFCAAQASDERAACSAREGQGEAPAGYAAVPSGVEVDPNRGHRHAAHGLGREALERLDLRAATHQRQRSSTSRNESTGQLQRPPERQPLAALGLGELAVSRCANALGQAAVRTG